jgi:hypothetical protein
LGDPLKGNLLLFYKPLHLEAQQVSTRIEVRRHQPLAAIITIVFYLLALYLFAVPNTPENSFASIYSEPFYP